MQKTNPLVTVYMPTHNRCILLERALKSVIDQTYKNLEIIVVDDGSTDDTEQFMQEFMIEYPNVKYLKHDTPKGANAARNYAIKEAQGYFITGLDDDDEMLPFTIEILVNEYEDKYAYVFGGLNIISPTKNYIISSAKKIITLDDMLYGNITGNQIFTTRELFLQAGLFDEKLEAAQDYDMWLRMLTIKHTAKAIQKPLYNVYELIHNRISTSNNRFKGYFKCYLKHKTHMSTVQRKIQLAYLHKVQGKKLTQKKINILFPVYKWPRLYLGFYKRQYLSSK